MPYAELSHTYRIAAPPQEVIAHLSDPAHYVGLSPLVVAVRDVRHDQGVTNFVAVERFRFLRVLRHDNLIKVSLVAGAGGISGDVRSPAGVRMTYRFDVAQDADAGGGGSAVTDTLGLRTPFGLLRFAASQARAVQIARGRVLGERLDRPV
jgi:hypothetical protein